MSENRREHFRVFFDHSIDGDITRHGGHSLSVEIENISIGGMRFSSPYNLQLEEKVTCSFNIFDISFSIDGFIIHKFTKTHTSEYGVIFEIDQNISSDLFKQLNNYQIRQRKDKYID